MFKLSFSNVLRFTVLAVLGAVGIAFNLDLCGFQQFVMSSASHMAANLDGFGTGCLLLAVGSLAPFPIDPDLTAVAVAYRNRRFIADEVCPRTPVGKQSFKFRLYALADGFTIPNTRVGRTSKPNQMTFGFTDQTSSTEDFGLDDPVPQEDIENAPAGYDPRAHASQMLANLVALDREQRVATLLFTAANYAAANQTALVGNAQLSDFTNSDPLGVISTALDTPVMRPNIAVFGRSVWSTLRRHPKIMKAVNRNSGDTGMASLDEVRNLLELDQIYVGEAMYSTAKRGQTPVIANLWGKCMAFIYRDSLATVNSGMTFCLTAQWGTRVSGSIADPDAGLRGGQRVRVGESVKELITANDLGYFVDTAIA